MERIGIAVDEKRCGNCASYETGNCWHINAHFKRVFAHNTCIDFKSKSELLEALKEIDDKYKMQVLKSQLINPQKVCGVIASYGSYCYEDACEGMDRRCGKLTNAGIRYAYTADGSLLSIFVDDENYVRANETLNS